MNCTNCGADNDYGLIVCKKYGNNIVTGSGTVTRPTLKRGNKVFATGISKTIVAMITVTAFLLFSSCSAPADTASSTGNTAPADTASSTGNSTPADTAPESGNKAQEFGNTPMNIQNMGLAAENGGWIYYSNSGDAWTLYKIREDGTEKTKLNKERSTCINVAGGWVYYSSIGSNSGSICRVRTDGTDGEILKKNMRAPQVLVYRDWIYYTGWSQEDIYLYRMKTDGAEETCFNIKTTAFNIEGGWIYFTDRSDRSDLKYYKMRLDGSEKTGVDADYSMAAFIDGWIYYCDEGHPAKMRSDGTERKILTEDNVRYFNVADGWVYYASGSDGENIYKMRTDGTEITKLNAGSAYFLINIAGDWIYYNISGEYYRMKTDGSENQKVE